jgi:hypothetical protein
MKIRTLLLGTATAITMVGGAQAADLAVAEPVDYVKVCDAYGAGYFYIPGSDTCLKIGGFVKGYIDFYSNTMSITSLTGPSASYNYRWQWTTEASIQLQAQSMSDIGLITSWLDYRAKHINGVTTFGIDSAYLKAGPVKMGYFTNIFYYGGQYGEIGVGGGLDGEDITSNQLAFSTSMGGLGLWLGIADNRDNAGGAAYYESSWPDVIAAVTGSSGGFDWKLAAAATDTVFGTGYAAQIGAAWTAGNGDAIRVKAAFGNSQGSSYVDSSAPDGSGDTIWSALIAGVHYWSSTVQTDLAASYSSKLGGWDLGVETDWLVAKNTTTAVSLDYNTASENWAGEFRLVRAF